MTADFRLFMFSVKEAQFMSSLTICLLNYKRPDNYQRIIPALAAQTIKPKIFMWNNGERFTQGTPFLKHIDWLIESGVNRHCWPRWQMAAYAETEFVCSWDDDMVPIDIRLFEDVVAVYQELHLSGAVGPFGVEFIKTKPYSTCWHHKASKMRPKIPRAKLDGIQGTPAQQAQEKRKLRKQYNRTLRQVADMIKGRHILLPTAELLRHSPIADQQSKEDDIILCSALAGKKPGKHNVLARYQGAFEDLDTDDSDTEIAISRHSDHYIKRQQARNLFFPGL